MSSAGSVSTQVAHCYPEHMASFPQQLKELLSYHHTVLDADLRMVRPHQSVFGADGVLQVRDQSLWFAFQFSNKDGDWRV